MGIYEGGATYATGVWRPAASCAMNTGGSRFCPVCREAAVLAIYGYVSPIDGSSPEEDEVTPGLEGPPAFRVVPMAPATHDLEVAWYLGPAPEPGPGAAVAAPEPTAADDFADDFLSEEQRRAFERRRRERAAAGTPDPGASPAPASEALPGTESPPKAPARGGARRSLGTGHEARPSGAPLRARRVTLPDGRKASEAVLPPLATLAPGRHLLTAVVRDPTRIRGERFPWVLKDDRGLLEDRRAWVLVVPAPSPR